MTKRTAPVIRVEHLEVKYGRHVVLRMEQLRVDRGEQISIIGPSGAGKTTLLRTIKGYVRPTRGKVEVLGLNWSTCDRATRRRVQRRIGLVFQQFHLVPRLTVLQNVLCGRLGSTGRWASLLGHFTSEDQQIAWRAICEVGLQEQVHQRADTLSGGQQQRVAIARVVAQQPEVILADEPVSSLDPVLGAEVLSLLREVTQHHDATLILILHQPALAKKFGNRVVGLRDGTVVFDDLPSKLTDDRLEEIYHGYSPVPLHRGDSPTDEPIALVGA
ncbi:MAG: phosphonate ABC transporter ATP-binding protein [Planctomycetes bacterium]|nr:phosphonate ABC transporter ATP-binding protein [Planctomycetota bacterium]